MNKAIATKTAEYREWATNKAVGVLMNEFQKAANDVNRTVNERSEKAYPCIHLSHQTFLDLVSFAIVSLGGNNSTKPIKFLDVGCGVGQKVFLANMFGLDAYGLDLRTNFVKKAQKLNQIYTYSFDKKKIFQANAISFKKYNEFDIIYFYRPAPDEKVQAAIEMAIAKGARIGAIVVGVYSELFGEKEMPGWKRIGDETWQRQSIN